MKPIKPSVASSGPDKAQVRLLVDNQEPRQAVGVGFLVSNQHVLTCAHVVDDVLHRPRGAEAPSPKSEPIFLDFPLIECNQPLRARVIQWHPVREEAAFGELEDIAVLELLDPRPPDAAPIIVVTLESFADRPVALFGFPRHMDAGDRVDGVLKGYIGTGKVQLDHIPGQREVAPGFSGAAVWDKQEKAAVGMVVSIDTREAIRSAYMIPVAALKKVWPALDEHSRPANPYRGLEVFREQDADLFFGRQDIIEKLYQAVMESRFVAVVGASGTGKSSLVFAGLIPRLRQQGDVFLSTVVRSFTQSYSGKKLLLFVDQFEELYTQNPDKSETWRSTLQQRFVDRLLEAIASDTPVTVLITLRADFMGRALEYEPFTQALNRFRKHFLGPMTQAQLGLIKPSLHFCLAP
jgi:hypothetical protein